MANHALFVGWHKAVAGYEAISLELFTRFVGNLGKWQKEGRLESFDVVALEAHGGDLGGFALIKGDRQKLDALIHDDEWQRDWVQGMVVMNGLGLCEAHVGDALMQRMGRFQQAIAALPKK
jgi:hypothetical protein